jgi:hypothetical protein
MKTLRQAALIVGLTTALALPAAALAPLPFTEDFAANASGWLTGDSTAPIWSSSGWVDGSGYISFTAPEFTSGTNSFPGAPPLRLMFRGNNANDASGDAFVGNWLADGVVSLSLIIRHNYTEPLNFYARLAASGGAGASLAFDSVFAIQATNTWTTVTIPIVDSNPPFVSYGMPGATFTSVFTNMQNLQFGLYLPTNTTFADLRMDIDSVSIVPEPSTWALLGCGAAVLAGLALRRRSKS